MWGSRWTGVAILSRSGDKYFRFRPGLAAAILNYRLPVTSVSIRHSTIELLDHENVRVAVGTALLSCLEAEICVYRVYAAILGAILNFSLVGNSPIASGMSALFPLCFETSV